MKHHIITTLGLALSLAVMAVPTHAQQARSPELPPVIIEAFETLCFPIVHEGGDADALTAAYTSPGLSERRLSGWITQRWAWEEKQSVDSDAFAVLHMSDANRQACELDYEFIDEDADTSFLGAQIKQWAAGLPGFTATRMTDSFAVWANVEQRTELILSTSYSKGVVILSYSRK